MSVTQIAERHHQMLSVEFKVDTFDCLESLEQQGSLADFQFALVEETSGFATEVVTESLP